MIIFLQVYAVYNRNKKVILALAGICLSAHISALVIAILYRPHGETDDTLAPHYSYHLLSCRTAPCRRSHRLLI